LTKLNFLTESFGNKEVELDELYRNVNNQNAILYNYLRWKLTLNSPF